jgi:hypothetical protein
VLPQKLSRVTPKQVTGKKHSSCGASEHTY